MPVVPKMIQNGKVDVESHNRIPNHITAKKTSHASSRGPYLQERRTQATGFHSIQNGGGYDKGGSASFKNGDSFNGNDSTKYQGSGWNTNLPADDNSDLSYEQMWEWKSITDKRVKNKISEGLSPEGRKAMELARAELEYSKRKGKNYVVTKGDNKYTPPELELPNDKKKGKVKKKISFVDAYEGSSASRLSGDIMDENSSDGTPKRWALGGGNINVAMETVEIVSYGETQSDSDAYDMAIEETAKLNSVEKCLVWMGVHTDSEYDEQR